MLTKVILTAFGLVLLAALIFGRASPTGEHEWEVISQNVAVASAGGQPVARIWQRSIGRDVPLQQADRQGVSTLHWMHIERSRVGWRVFRLARRIWGRSERAGHANTNELWQRAGLLS